MLRKVLCSEGAHRGVAGHGRVGAGVRKVHEPRAPRGGAPFEVRVRGPGPVQATSCQQRRALLRSLVQRRCLSCRMAAALRLKRCAAGGFALAGFGGLPGSYGARHCFLMGNARLLRRCRAQGSSGQRHAGLSILRSSICAFSLSSLPIAELILGVACMPVCVAH